MRVAAIYTLMYWYYLECSELERGLGLESSIRQPPLRLVLERIIAPQELHASHCIWHIRYLLACLDHGPIGKYVIFKSCLPILHFVCFPSPKSPRIWAPHHTLGFLAEADSTIPDIRVSKKNWTTTNIRVSNKNSAMPSLIVLLTQLDRDMNTRAYILEFLTLLTCHMNTMAYTRVCNATEKHITWTEEHCRMYSGFEWCCWTMIRTRCLSIWSF